MVQKIKDCIIVGGGSSIKQADSATLKPLLASKFTILTNYSFKHFEGTFMCFLDTDFYKPTYAKHNKSYPDIYEELKQLPLIVGINHSGIAEFKLDNTILLNQKYGEFLTGIFALKLAEQIINEGIIYLLGFDWNRRIGLPEKDPDYNPYSDLSIHYYTKEEINHPGIGRIGYYENHNPDKIFEKFKKKDIKIYNVSLESNINCFEKISYVQFFEHMSDKINDELINQNELRIYIKEKLICIK